MKGIEHGWILIGLTTVMAMAFSSAARADVLGRVIAGGVTNQALTQVTQNDCSNATGAGADACDAADAVVDVHRDVSNAVNQEVQNTCQNASGVGEDACQGIADVNSFKKQLSEQVDHIHLFGSSDNNSSDSTPSSPSGNESPTNETPASPENPPSGNDNSPSDTPTNN